MEKLNKDIAAKIAVYGYREVAKFISEGSIAHVVIATDADNDYKNKLIRLCTAYNLPYRLISHKEELGKLAGLDVGCAVIGFRKGI